MAEGYFPALMKVIFAHMSPSQALEQGESYLAHGLRKNSSDPT